MSAMTELAAIKSEGGADGGELRACRGCLATDLPLFDLEGKGLAQIFGDFTGIPVLVTDTYPQQVCVMCKHQLSKFYEFRLRCHSAMFLIQQMLQDGVKVTTESLSTIDRNHIKLNLTQTDLQITSLDGCEESLLDGVDTFSNVVSSNPAVNIINTIDIANDDSDDDKPLYFFNQLKDEKIHITALEIENDVDDDNFVSNQSDDTDAKIKIKKLPMKRKRVKKENVNNKRLKKNGTDKEENVTLKRFKKTAMAKKETAGIKANSEVKNEVSYEEQDLLKTIANVIRSAWMVSRGASYTTLWEKVHKESLNDSHELLDCKDLSQWSMTQKINQYICLSKKLAALYNSELKFSCLAEQKKEIEDRRASDKYQKAPFKCELCCRHYSFEDTYRRHMVSHDPRSGDVICEVCLYRFKNRKRYMTHYHTYHTKTIVCKTCGVVNREWNNAKHHFKWHGGAATVCEQCGKHFPDRKLYCMHIRSVHRAVLATTLCLLCGDTYNGTTGVKMHMDKTHRECERCPTCNTQFASGDALATHLALNDAACDTLSACPVCGHNFPSELSMREHYDTMHKKEFKCDQCGRVADTLTQFTRHVRQCLARRRRGRPTRNEVRPRIPGMPREKGAAIMAGDKKVYNLKLMCELCGKGNFKCFSTLRSHQRVHTGERPFQCQMCHKSFRELQFLKNHTMTHTDERRYKCPYCAKAFRQQGHRAAHILTHTKERPYACDTCSKRYTGQTALKEHINTAHRGLPPRQRGKNKDRQEL